MGKEITVIVLGGPNSGTPTVAEAVAKALEAEGLQVTLVPVKHGLLPLLSFDQCALALTSRDTDVRVLEAGLAPGYPEGRSSRKPAETTGKT